MNLDKYTEPNSPEGDIFRNFALLENIYDKQLFVPVKGKGNVVSNSSSGESVTPAFTTSTQLSNLYPEVLQVPNSYWANIALQKGPTSQLERANSLIQPRAIPAPILFKRVLEHLDRSKYERAGIQVDYEVEISGDRLGIRDMLNVMQFKTLLSDYANGKMPDRRSFMKLMTEVCLYFVVPKGCEDMPLEDTLEWSNDEYGSYPFMAYASQKFLQAVTSTVFGSKLSTAGYPLMTVIKCFIENESSQEQQLYYNYLPEGWTEPRSALEKLFPYHQYAIFDKEDFTVFSRLFRHYEETEEPEYEVALSEGDYFRIIE